MSRDYLFMHMPNSMQIAPQWPAGSVEFDILSQCGGIEVRPRAARIVTAGPPSVPSHLPGVEAMLEDGWTWDGWREVFKREGGVVSLTRVESGRYTERLPTNRKRARQRKKQARREEAIAHGWNDGKT